MLAKIVAIFSLTTAVICGYAEASTIETQMRNDGGGIKITNLESVGLPTQSDFEDGTAALKRMISVNELPDRVPRNLIELNEALNGLIQKIRSDEKPDNIDVLLLVDTNGKTQTAAAVRFLANLENALIEHAQSKNPRLKLKLACVFDSFVAAGSGVIPAAVGALGGITQEEALPHVWEMPSKMLYPKAAGSFFSCCGCLGDTAEAIVSAYFATPEIAEKNSPDWDSLTYDSFEFSKVAAKKLIELFGSHTAHDLKSSLEVISLHDSELISELVFATISARDNDALSHVRRVAISEAFSNAQSIISVASHASNGGESSEKFEKVSNGIEHFSVLLKKSLHKKYGSLSELRNSLKKRTDIQRDMLILTVSADTFSGHIMVPSFSYDVKRTRNGKNIVNLNYRFAIPSHFYEPKKEEMDFVHSTVESGVSSVFPRENARKTNISTATGLLINFLNECNDRIIQAVEDAHIFDQPQIEEEDSEDSEEICLKKAP